MMNNEPSNAEIKRYEIIRSFAKTLLESAVFLEMTPHALLDEIRSHMDDSIEDF